MTSHRLAHRATVTLLATALVGAAMSAGAPAASAYTRRTDCLTGARVSGHGGHTLLVTPDRRLYATGGNESGQLGLGTKRPHNHFTEVTALTDVVFAETAASTSYAIRADGTVWGWGENYAGQTGDGTTVDRVLPGQITALTGASLVTGNGDAGYALMPDGTVWSWGNNWNGALGDGTTTDRYTPAPVPGVSDVVDIGSGYNRAWVLRSDGTVWGWGYNWSGELGGGERPKQLTAVPIPGLTGFVALARHSSMGVRADGTVWRWGRDGVQQVAGITDAVAVSSGGSNTYVLRAGGTLLAWGNNYRGGVGDGTTEHRVTPVPVVDVAGVTSFSVAGGGGAAIDAAGDVRVWGYNGYGEYGTLGLGGREFRTRPVQSGCPEIPPYGVTALAPADGAVFASDERLRGFRVTASDIEQENDRFRAEITVRDAAGGLVGTWLTAYADAGGTVELEIPDVLPSGRYTWTATAIDEWGYRSTATTPVREFRVRTPSSECGADTVLYDVAADGTRITVSTRRIDAAVSWVCARVSSGATFAGGRFVVDTARLAAPPSFDGSGGWCRTAPANRLPREYGELGLYLDDYELYVCAATRRVGVPTGPATFVLDGD